MFTGRTLDGLAVRVTVNDFDHGASFAAVQIGGYSIPPEWGPALVDCMEVEES